MISSNSDCTYDCYFKMCSHPQPGPPPFEQALSFVCNQLTHSVGENYSGEVSRARLRTLKIWELERLDHRLSDIITGIFASHARELYVRSDSRALKCCLGGGLGLAASVFEAIRTGGTFPLFASAPAMWGCFPVLSMITIGFGAFRWRYPKVTPSKPLLQGRRVLDRGMLLRRDLGKIVREKKLIERRKARMETFPTPLTKQVDWRPPLSSSAEDEPRPRPQQPVDLTSFTHEREQVHSEGMLAAETSFSDLEMFKPIPPQHSAPELGAPSRIGSPTGHRRQASRTSPGKASDPTSMTWAND